MKHLTLLFLFMILLCSRPVNAQRIKAKQLTGETPKSALWVMGTDTVSGSNTYGQGKWFLPTDTAYAIGTDTIVVITLDGDTLIFDTGDVPDQDWLETGGLNVPDMDSDSMYHTGNAALGGDSDTTYEGKLNIIPTDATQPGIVIYRGYDAPVIKTYMDQPPSVNENSWTFYITDTGDFLFENVYDGGSIKYPFGMQPNAPNSSLFIAANGDINLSQYPNTRDDGSPTNVLATDASGNLRSYPVADVTGAGSSDHDWYEQGTTTPPNNIDDNMFSGTGNHGIGTTSPAKPLHVVGEARITGTGGTATSITGRDTDGDITNVTTGWGVDLTSGILLADSSQVATQYDLTLAVAGGMSNWLLAASGTGGTESITNGETVTLTAGTGISATRSTNNVTISNTGVITEVDGSITNEGILGVGAGGASSSTITTNTSTGNAVTINVAGINTISESTSANGGSITITGTEVDGSVSNELNTIEEGNVSVQSSNTNIDFQSMFDVATDGAGEVNVSFDGGEATTVTTPEADDYLLMYDAGTPANQKILYSDIASLIGDGNGIFDATNDGGTVPTTFDVALTNTLNYDAGTLYIDGTNNRIGIGTTSPDNTFNVEATAQLEGKIRDLADVCDFYLEGTVTSAASVASFRFDNKDTDIDHTGDYYQVANLTPTKRSASAPGGYLNFNIGYDTLLLDNVFRIASRETGATMGYVKMQGGQRNAWTDDATTAHTLNTGEYGLVMTNTAAKTVTLPTITTGGVEPNRGQVFRIYNDAATGSITVSASGGNTIVGTSTITPGSFVTIEAATSTKWISQ